MAIIWLLKRLVRFMMMTVVVVVTMGFIGIIWKSSELINAMNATVVDMGSYAIVSWVCGVIGLSVIK